MKFRKYLLTFVLVILSIFGLSGCAKVEFIRAVDSQDVIIDKLIIEVDESKINKSGVDLNTVMTAINDDMVAFRISVEKWKLQFVGYPEIMDSIEKGIYVEVTPIKNKISLAIQFSNWQMFGLFYGYTEIEDFEYSAVMEDVGPFIDNIINEEYSDENYGLFLIKYSMLKNNGILDNIEDFEYSGNNYYDKYVSMTNNHYNLSDISLSQIFAYPDDRIYSNADESYVEGNMTFMLWNLSDKDENFEMQMYKLYPRSTRWYALALIISAIFVVVITIVIARKHKKEPIEKITRWEVEKDGE